MTAMLAVGIGLLAAPAAARERYPVLWIFPDSTRLGASGGIEFGLDDLDSAGNTERIQISVPSGYALSLARAVGANLGSAFLDGSGGRSFKGTLTEMDPAAYASSASAQACAAGRHSAIWEMHLKSAGTSLAIPIAVDRSAGGYQMTMCLDDAHALGVEAAAVDFYRNGGFVTPTRAGRYQFASLVTPFAPDGTPDTTSVYELRAIEPLPRSISLDASYTRATKTLRVSGVAVSQGKPMRGRSVDVQAAVKLSAFAHVAYVTTNAAGEYVFAKHVATVPRYVAVSLQNDSYESCAAATSAPAGCASYTTGGIASGYIRVTVR